LTRFIQKTSTAFEAEPKNYSEKIARPNGHCRGEVKNQGISGISGLASVDAASLNHA